jgi:hypothetical protein
MADPRNAVDFEGIGILTATYKIDNSTIVYDATKPNGAATTMIGKAVALSADDTVRLAEDGDAIEGKLLLVESDDKCTVQVGGYTDLPGGASATLTRGSAIVGALGASSAKGHIRSAASGTAAELIKCRGRIIRNATTTAVVVHLD